MSNEHYLAFFFISTSSYDFLNCRYWNAKVHIQGEKPEN